MSSTPAPYRTRSVTSQRRRNGDGDEATEEEPQPPQNHTTNVDGSTAATHSNDGATPTATTTGTITAATATATPRFHFPPQSASSFVSSAVAATDAALPSTLMSSSFTMMGQNLVQAKISPKSSSLLVGSASTTPSIQAARNRRSKVSAMKSTPTITTTNTTQNAAAAAAAMDDTHMTGVYKSIPTPMMMDGVDVTRLRLLVSSSLGISASNNNNNATNAISGVPCPSSTTIFFAGILYGKTLAVHDNWLYAMALYQTCYGATTSATGVGASGGGGSGIHSHSSPTNSNFKRLLAWLEKPDDGLLTTRGGCGGGTSSSSLSTRDGIVDVTSGRYYWDAVLWAATAYTNLGDFTAVTQLWTEHCVGSTTTTTQAVTPGGTAMYGSTRRGSVNTSTTLLSQYLASTEFWNGLDQFRAGKTNGSRHQQQHSSSQIPTNQLEDNDLDGWAYLGHCLRRNLGSASSSSSSSTQGMISSTMTTTYSIHPLSRILCFRANAYKQLGHPQRASIVYLTAFKIDPYCVDAFDGWIDNGGCGTTKTLSQSSDPSTDDYGIERNATGRSTMTSSHAIPTAEQLSTTLHQILDGDHPQWTTGTSTPVVLVDDWLKMYYWAKLFASGASVGSNAGLVSSSFMRPSMVPQQGSPQDAFIAASSYPPPVAAGMLSPSSLQGSRRARTAITSATGPTGTGTTPNGPGKNHKGFTESTSPRPPNLGMLQRHLQSQIRPFRQVDDHATTATTTTTTTSEKGHSDPFEARAAETDEHLNTTGMSSTDQIGTADHGVAMETPASGGSGGKVFFPDDRTRQQHQHALFPHPNLTPIPQQTSMSVINMSTMGGAPVQATNDTKMKSTGQGKDVSMSNPASFAILAENSALDSLWNKYKLQKSPEILAMAAQQSYRCNDLQSTLKYCQALAEMDPLSSSSAVSSGVTSIGSSGPGVPTFLSSSSDAIYKAGFIHICTLVALNHKRTLFRLAHEWVDAAPRSCRAWFAVGAYYYACRQFHVAQRHFCRATRLDPHCPEAWIAFGASFSACDESDQALASFRAAQRLAPGHHVSLLYMGMEYLRTNHIVLAQHFLTAAYEASNMSDALCMSELGVMSCQKSEYGVAVLWFLGALAVGNRASERSMKWDGSDASTWSSGAQSVRENSKKFLAELLEQVQDEYWEPTLFNLAQAYRKQYMYDMAVQCLERALALKESANGYSSLGFCLHLKSATMAAEALKATQLGRDFSSHVELTPGNTPHARNQILHRAIDAYHQSLAKKPEDPFCSEMLQKALTDALEQADFFLQGDVDENELPNGRGNNHKRLGKVNGDGMTTPSTSSSRYQRQGRQSMESTSSSFLSMIGSAGRGRGHGGTNGRPPRTSTGDQSAATMTSQFTEDGLSLSVETADDGDVDMS